MKRLVIAVLLSMLGTGIASAQGDGARGSTGKASNTTNERSSDYSTGGSTDRSGIPPLGASGTMSSGAESSSADTSGASGSGSAKSAGGKLSDEDREFMEDLAHANLAEIETGRMALEKGQSEQVKKFAQKMIDEHTTALKELQTLAQGKGVKLPTETDLQHKTIATALKALSGETFDSQYIARVGVGDHERTHGLLQEVMKKAKDADLKAYATKTEKVVSEHLKTAKTMEGKK